MAAPHPDPLPALSESASRLALRGERETPVTDWQWLIIDVLQSLAAGLLVGGIYGLMCVGLGIIFGVMRVVNFAQGDFMMLGMYAAFYLVTGFGVLAFLGPYAGPFVGAMLAGPLVFVGRRAAAPLPDRARHRRARGLGRGGRPLRPDHPHARHLAGAAERRADPVRLAAGLRADAAVAPSPGRSATILLQQGRTVAFVDRRRLSRSCSTCSWRAPRLGKALRAAADNPTAATYVGIDVDRAHRLAFGLGVGITAVAGGLMASTSVVRALHRLRLRHHHVLGRRAGRHGQHPRRVLGRAHRRLRAAVLGADPAAQLQNAAIFVVFLLIVFFRPQGLFGRVGGARMRPAPARSCLRRHYRRDRRLRRRLPGCSASS